VGGEQVLQHRRARPREADHEDRALHALVAHLGVAAQPVLHPQAVAHGADEALAQHDAGERGEAVLGLHAVDGGAEVRQEVVVAPVLQPRLPAALGEDVVHVEATERGAGPLPEAGEAVGDLEERAVPELVHGGGHGGVVAPRPRVGTSGVTARKPRDGAGRVG
jgi:hypothetical protein